MNSRNFLIFIIFFAVGAFAGSFFTTPNFSFYLGLFFVFLGSIFYLLKIVSLPAGKAGLNFTILGLTLLALGAGLFWYGFNSALPANISFLESRVGERVVLEGIVVDEPDERENYTRYIFKESESEVKILVTAKRYPVFNYGDKIKIKGVLKKPSSGEDFDWRAYLAKDDIYFEVFYPSINFISAGQASYIKQKLLEFKYSILSNISKVVPEPHSALLGGLTFGAKQSMTKDLLESFRKTGIIHIVVLSGYNITIVADTIMRVLSFLPFVFSISFGALGIIIFAIMAGASATVVRASLMALLVLLARATGRIYEITIALFVAGFFMILHNPKIIRFDASFQLSFLATMSLIYIAPILNQQPWVKKFITKKFQIREIVSATISTQLFVLPLLLYKTGLLSIVGLPVNLLILFFVPATMFFGFLTAGLGFLSPFLSAPFGWISYALLNYELKVVEIFANLPFASFEISSFPLWLMLTIYIIYAILIYRFKNLENNKQ